MKWIDVKKRLPDDGETVLVMYFDGTGPVLDSVGDRNFFNAKGEDESHKVWFYSKKQVYHWCAIPSYEDIK